MEELAREFGHPTYTPFTRGGCATAAGDHLWRGIGFEREWRDRPAGLRTHILVCVAAATFAILTIEIVHAPMFEESAIRSRSAARRRGGHRRRRLPGRRRW